MAHSEITKEKLRQAALNRPTIPLEVRFAAKVNKGSDCWLWAGAKDRAGYGLIETAGAMEGAHRVAYRLYIGECAGSLVLHRCDNKSCVNPDHLFLGTQADNMKDKVAKGRQARGETNGNSKISDLQAQEMVSLRGQGMMVKDIAAKFGVSRVTVTKITLGQTGYQLAKGKSS